MWEVARQEILQYILRNTEAAAGNLLAVHGRRPTIVRIASIVFCVAFIVTATASAEQWQVFRDPDNVYSFASPGPVHSRRHELKSPEGISIISTGQTFLVANGKGACGVIKNAADNMVYPDDGAKQLAVTERTKLAAQGIKPSSDEPLTVDGHPGWRQDFVDTAGALISDRRFVIKGDIFIVSCSIPASTSTDDKASIERFYKSFHFTNK